MTLLALLNRYRGINLYRGFEPLPLRQSSGKAMGQPVALGNDGLLKSEVGSCYYAGCDPVFRGAALGLPRGDY